MEQEELSLEQLKAPRYWPWWALIGFLWTIAHLPFPVQMLVGRTIGFLASLVPWMRRNVAEVNIKLCFPHLTLAERDKLLRQHFQSLGTGFIEMVMGWWMPNEKLLPLIEISGLEHLDQAMKDGNGVILLGAHFTSIELGGRLLVAKRPEYEYTVMYRPHENPVFEHFVKSCREERMGKVIARNNIRAMIRSLRNNKISWYAPDQNFGDKKNNIFVPFFGIPASTNPGTSRIAKVSGSPVIPFFTERKKDYSGYKLTLLPPLENFPSDDVEADAIRLNVLIEDQVSLIPEQYFWVHRRFKSRPSTGQDFYRSC